MRFARHCLIAAGAALILLTHASAAWAGTWVLPVSGGAPTLGFGAQYAGGTHRGVDLEAAAGAEVLAPAGGTVTFAGRVPADGGGTCGAVTIELADGQRVSLLPLEGVSVVSGNSIVAGDALGLLATSGDNSSAAAHLHVGLRSGELYLDPTPLLPCGGGGTPDAEPEVAPVTAPGPTAAAATGVAPVAPTAPVGSAAVASVSAPAGAGTVAEAEVAEDAPAVDAVPEVSAGPAATHAEVPVAEAAAPNDAPHTVRPGLHPLSFSARPVTSIVLALGMLATGIAIVRVRRASPVHVR